MYIVLKNLFRWIGEYDWQLLRPSQGFWGTGETGDLFQGNKGQILRGTKTILGNREHKKTYFRYWGNRGTSQFFQGIKGTGTSPGRASLFFIYLLRHHVIWFYGSNFTVAAVRKFKVRSVFSRACELQAKMNQCQFFCKFHCTHANDNKKVCLRLLS